jgi:hypothetical protein
MPHCALHCFVYVLLCVFVPMLYLGLVADSDILMLTVMPPTVSPFAARHTVRKGR